MLFTLYAMENIFSSVKKDLNCTLQYRMFLSVQNIYTVQCVSTNQSHETVPLQLSLLFLSLSLSILLNEFIFSCDTVPLKQYSTIYLKVCCGTVPLRLNMISCSLSLRTVQYELHSFSRETVPLTACSLALSLSLCVQYNIWGHSFSVYPTLNTLSCNIHILSYYPGVMLLDIYKISFSFIIFPMCIALIPSAAVVGVGVGGGGSKFHYHSIRVSC